MELTRRGFLQGLMGLAGVAVVGFPPVANTELIDEVEQCLEQGGEPEHPAGRWGSVRIGDTWYPLDSASITMSYAPFPIMTSDDRIQTMANSISQVDISLELGEPLRAFDFGRSLHEFEISTRDHYYKDVTVTGQCYIRRFGGNEVDLRADGLTRVMLA